jgi:hypothetical protein
VLTIEIHEAQQQKRDGRRQKAIEIHGVDHRKLWYLRGHEAVGYIDDVAILAVGPSTQHNCKTLKRSHRKAERWALQHGSQFAQAKYELVHFTREPQANKYQCT